MYRLQGKYCVAVTFPQRLSIMLFALTILFSVVAYDFFHIRASDILLILTAISCVLGGLGKINIRLLALSSFILVILLFSDFLSLSLHGFYSLFGGYFYYKYFVIFLVFFVSCTIFSRFFSRSILYAFMFFNLCLACWVVLSVYFLPISYLDANGRPSFPFSKDYSQSDAHLASALLGLGLVFYFSVLRSFLRSRVLTDFLFLSLMPAALVATGSRSGIAILGFFILTLCTINFFKNIFSFRLGGRFFKVLLLGLFLFFFIYFISSILAFDLFQYRAFNFDLIADESSNIRVEMFYFALGESSTNGYLFGAGPSAAYGYFYDGLASILIAHGGVLLLFLIFIIVSTYFFIVLSGSRGDFFRRSVVASFILAVFLANIISEYVFVTRGAIPMIAMLVFAWCSLGGDISDCQRR